MVLISSVKMSLEPMSASLKPTYFDEKSLDDIFNSKLERMGVTCLIQKNFKLKGLVNTNDYSIPQSQSMIGR